MERGQLHSTGWAEWRNAFREMPDGLIRAWPKDGRLIHPVAVEVAGDGLIAGLPKLERAIGRIDLAVAVAVDDPLPGAEDGDFFDAVAVEVADNGKVALLPELGRLIAVGPAAVAVDVEVPLAIAEDADGANAV